MSESIKIKSVVNNVKFDTSVLIQEVLLHLHNQMKLIKVMVKEIEAIIKLRTKHWYMY